MKTKEITFTVIQQIKNNNKLAEQLETIEKIVEDIYFNQTEINKLDIECIKNHLPQKDSEDPFDAESFVFCIWQFVQENQSLLQKNSKNLLT